MEKLEESASGQPCPNCQTMLQGRFCHRCGQEGRANLLSVRHFLAEAAHELFSVDGKLPRTVRLFLTAPGKLVREYIDGRRAPYLSPLRLYLLVSVVLFSSHLLFGKGAPLNVEEAFPARPEQARTTDEPAAPKAERRWERELDDWGRSAALFAIPPAAALVLMAAFRERNRYYAAHLALALHVQTLFLFFTTIEDLLRWPVAWMVGSVGSPADRVVRALVLLAPVPYALAAMRRVYELPWRTVLVKGTAVIVACMVAALAVTLVMAGMVVALGG